MVLDLLMLIGGLAMLIFGGERLVEGASALAYKWGMSQRMVGLTLVAFGTSAPELFVNLLASWYGQGDLTLGNIIGSNIFNLLAVMGIMALFTHIKVERALVLVEIPLSFMIGVAMYLLINDSMWEASEINKLERQEGLVLILFFIMFMYTVMFLSRGRHQSPDFEIKVYYPLWRALLYFIGGIILLGVGGEFTVKGAVNTALHLGVSVYFVSVLGIAFGTSLPELVTSIVALTKKLPSMSVANLIGSNIFNISFILALSAVVRPIKYDPIYNPDLWLFIISTFILWIMGMGLKGKKLELHRTHGIIMLLLFTVYITYIFVRELG